MGLRPSANPSVQLKLSVSVPLPGFMGLRRQRLRDRRVADRVSVPLPGFMGLRQGPSAFNLGQLAVSVPLPGFMGLRQLAELSAHQTTVEFQSRCRDSWGCDSFLAGSIALDVWFQSRCRDSWGCDEGLPELGDRAISVSVPLPGFMGLRHRRTDPSANIQLSFSPVAGIHGVATHGQRA